MNLHELSRFAAAGLSNSLPTGIVIAAFAWYVARLAARHGSGTRFAVWFVALIGIALLPWVGSFAASSYSKVPAPAGGALNLPESLACYFVIAWTVGASLGLAHVVHGLYRLRRLRATCTSVDFDQLDPRLRASLDEIQTRRSVALCVSSAVRVPAAIGYFRPIVVFPAWALSEIPSLELNAILLHELAHLRRYDDWTNLAQKVLKAIFFFHPAVWFIESRLTLEREMACDDAVLAANFAPRAYAESLVGLAEKSFLRRGVHLAQAAVSHVQQLKLRLTEILRKDKVLQGSGRLRKPALVLMSLAVMVAVYASARAPRLIAFSDSSAPTAALASSRASLVLPQASLRPVNLRDSGPAAPERVASQPRARRVPRVAPKPRAVFPQRAATTPVADDQLAAPTMVLANLPMELNTAPVLVLFESKQFGPDGPIFWQLTIVHLTPAQRRALTGGTAKQI